MQSDAIECSTALSASQRQCLQIFFNTTTIIPFELNNGLTCFFCAKPVSQYDDLKKHTKSHEISDIRQVFNKFYSKIIKVDVSDSNCEICDIQSHMDYNDLVNHLVSAHNLKDDISFFKCFNLKKLQCLECSQCFTELSKLEIHIKMKHDSNENSVHVLRKLDAGPVINNSTKYHFSCPKCFKILTSKLGFKIHLTNCGVKKEPRLLKERNTRTLKIRQNIASVIKMSTAIPFKFFKNRFRCFYCSKDFTDFDNLKDHNVSDHPNFSEHCKAMKMIKGRDVNVKIDISNLTCKLCFESALELNDLINHLILNHEINYDKSVHCLQSYRIVKDNIPCPICPHTVFRYFKKLLEHMNEFHSDNNIICAQCGLTFRGHPNYRAHMSRYHRTKACKCPDCNMEFWNLEKLARHRANVHGTKKYKCTQCVEKFITQHLMRKHQILVHGFGHKCPYCGKMFTRNSHMKNHVRRLHLKEKNVECTVCREKFFDRALLNVHMVKHVGERNYHCDVCGKKFLWKKNLRGHMSSHERNI